MFIIPLKDSNTATPSSIISTGMGDVQKDGKFL